MNDGSVEKTPQSAFLYKPEPNHNASAYPSAPSERGRIRREKVRAFVKVDHGETPLDGTPHPLHLPVEWDGVVP